MTDLEKLKSVFAEIGVKFEIDFCDDEVEDPDIAIIVAFTHPDDMVGQISLPDACFIFRPDGLFKEVITN